MIIYNHLTNESTFENLSNLIGVTPTHLCRMFRANYNMRPFEYIRRERIPLAKHLLMEKNKISDAARNSGFENDNYFREAFKKETGISPSEYRSKF